MNHQSAVKFKKVSTHVLLTILLTACSTNTVLPKFFHEDGPSHDNFNHQTHRIVDANSQKSSNDLT